MFKGLKRLFKGLLNLFRRPKMDVLVFNDKSTYFNNMKPDPFSKEAIAAHREIRRRSDNIRKGVK